MSDDRWFSPGASWWHKAPWGFWRFMKTNGNDEVYFRKENRSGWVNSIDYTIGLTKREKFAAMAMQALLSIPEVQNEWSHNGICREAVKHADALIQALNEGKEDANG